jgi:hypothetical protein
MREVSSGNLGIVIKEGEIDHEFGTADEIQENPGVAPEGVRSKEWIDDLQRWNVLLGSVRDGMDADEWKIPLTCLLIDGEGFHVHNTGVASLEDVLFFLVTSNDFFRCEKRAYGDVVFVGFVRDAGKMLLKIGVGRPRLLSSGLRAPANPMETRAESGWASQSISDAFRAFSLPTPPIMTLTGRRPNLPA